MITNGKQKSKISRTRRATTNLCLLNLIDQRMCVIQNKKNDLSPTWRRNQTTKMKRCQEIQRQRKTSPPITSMCRAVTSGQRCRSVYTVVYSVGFTSTLQPGPLAFSWSYEDNLWSFRVQTEGWHKCPSPPSSLEWPDLNPTWNALGSCATWDWISRDSF